MYKKISKGKPMKRKLSTMRSPDWHFEKWIVKEPREARAATLQTHNPARMGWK